MSLKYLTRGACAEGEFSLLFAVPNSSGERLRLRILVYLVIYDSG